MERYSAFLRIQSGWGEIRTSKTPNTDTFTHWERFAKMVNGFCLETQVPVKTPARKAPSLDEIKKMKERQANHSSMFIIIFVVH